MEALRFNKMDIPYDKDTLKEALIRASSKLETEGLQEKMLSKISQFSIPDRVTYNRQVADYHGISVPDLINSPNYTTLTKQYSEKSIFKIFNVYKEFGFDDKESWALICLSFGNLFD